MHPLDGSRLKIKRAGQHLNVLKRHVRRFGKDHPYRIREDADRETGQYVKSVVVPQAPPQWSLIIGDIAHNLRSALDHLAWQLAIRSSPTRNPENEWDARQISWPIYCDPLKYRGKRKDRVWRKDGLVSPFDQMVENCQPYKRWANPKEDPLWLLHELSNLDKHRELHATLIDLRELPAAPFREVSVDPETGEKAFSYGPPEYPVKEIEVVVGPGAPEAQVYVEGDFPFEVEITNPGSVLHEQPVLRLVESIRREVKGVIAVFDPVL